jgi:hypothetical protein
MKVTVLKPFWLAHPHWAREAGAEGRGQWEPALLSELPRFGAQSGAE